MAAVAPARMVSACAPTKVRSVSSYRGEESLPRPDRVLVYDFAISLEEVSLNRGLFARFGREVTSASTTENELQIAREVADGFSTEPVKRIQRLGLPAERAAADQVAPAGALAQVALQTAHGPLAGGGVRDPGRERPDPGNQLGKFFVRHGWITEAEAR